MIPSVDERTTRATRGMLTIPTAMITLVMPGPSTATIASGSTIVGNAKSASTTRWIT